MTIGYLIALIFGIFPLYQLCMDFKPRLIPPLIPTLPSLKKFQNWENWVGNDSFNIKSLEISKFLGCHQPALLTLVSASALATADVESVNYCQHVHQLLDCICICISIGHSRYTIGDQKSTCTSANCGHWYWMSTFQSPRHQPWVSSVPECPRLNWRIRPVVTERLLNETI